MHEMSLCESAIMIVEQQARLHQANSVTAVWLEVGALACVETSALRFCFDAVSRNTIAAGCKLHIDISPAKAWCWDCCKSVDITKRAQPCPHCQGFSLRVDEGEDLRVKNMEIS